MKWVNLDNIEGILKTGWQKAKWKQEQKNPLGLSQSLENAFTLEDAREYNIQILSQLNPAAENC